MSSKKKIGIVIVVAVLAITFMTVAFLTTQRKVPFQSLLTSGHIDPKWRKLKGRHLLGAVF